MFLRTLGSYKIPAVIERRRKELLDKLCLLQGDSIKEPPPQIEPVEEQPISVKARTGSVRGKTPTREEGSSSASSSTVTSPTHGGKLTRSDSKVVTSLVKDYESIHHTAKKEEAEETPKRLVQLKKVAKPTDFPGSPPHSPTGEEKEEEEKKKEEEKKEEKKATADEKKKDTLEVSGRKERASSIISSNEEEEEEGEEEADGKSGKKKKKLKIGIKVKKNLKKNKSPLLGRKNPSSEAAAEVEESQDNGEEKEKEEAVPTAAEAEVETTEEGVRMKGTLERKQKKGIGGTKKTKVEVKVRQTTVLFGDKEEIELVGYSVEETEGGFELTHPQHKLQTFKVDGGDEEREKWLNAFREAIKEATPPEEEKEEGMH